MSLRALIQQNRMTPDVIARHRSECLLRIKKQNSDSNALLYTCERPLSYSLCANDLPLYGLNYVVKGNVSVSGLPLSFGLKMPVKKNVACDAGLVSLLDALGAQLIGTTTLDQMCLGSSGCNPVLGDVINPEQPEMLVGGSSSGSAVAVSSSFCDFAIGTDCGGSLRIPAALNGLCAIKLSSGSVPAEGILLYDYDLDCPGFITGSIDDLLLLCEATLPDHSRSSEVTGLVIPDVYSEDICDGAVAAQFGQLVNCAGVAFEIVEKQLRASFEQIAEARKLIMSKAVVNKIQELSLAEDELPEEARALTVLAGLNANEKVAAIRSGLEDLIDVLLPSGAVFLSPALPCSVPLLRADSSTHLLNIFLNAANLFDLPAAVFSLARVGEGTLPVQIVGRKGEELSVIAAAFKLQKSVSQ